MFKQLYDALSDGEQAQMVLSRSGDDLVVSIVPRVGGEDGAGQRDEAAEQLRSALAYPMRLKDDPEKLDRVFVPQMREYAKLRMQISGQSMTLEKMRAQAVKGDKAVDKATKAAAKKSKSDSKEDQATQAETNVNNAGSAGESQSDAGASSNDAGKAEAQSAPAAPPAPSTSNPAGLFD